MIYLHSYKITCKKDSGKQLIAKGRCTAAGDYTIVREYVCSYNILYNIHAETLHTGCTHMHILTSPTSAADDEEWSVTP